MRKISSLILAGAASFALLAAPALAQNTPNGDQGGMSAPSSASPPSTSAPSASAPSSASPPPSMSAPKSASTPKKKMAKKKPMKTAAMSMKHTCMDYAWQSQDEKDCEAGKTKPPMQR